MHFKQSYTIDIDIDFDKNEDIEDIMGEADMHILVEDFIRNIQKDIIEYIKENKED